MSGVEFIPEQAGPQMWTGPAPTAADPEWAEPLAQPAASRQSKRRHLGPRSLTARLIVGVVALVLLLVVLISGGTWYSLRYFLNERLNQQLQTTASGQLDILFELPRRGPVGLRAPQDIWAVALATNGSLITYPSNGMVESMHLSATDRKALVARNTQTPTTVETLDGKQLRVTTRPATALRTDGTQASAVAVVGLSTEEERRTLDRLVKLELVIGASAVLLALLATSYGVRFSLRHLRRVTTTAQDVAAELSPTGAGLERRVDVPDDGSEVGQLAESMNTLLSAVETQFAQRLASEQRLRQFLADASHELRTPLTSIRGYAELARMQRASGANADDNLSRIESEGTRMSRLVEDLLTLARGDQQAGSQPARELVDVAEVVEDAVSDTRAAFPDRRIDAELAPDLHVIGDGDQLLQAVRNLVANAAVHTAPDRPILARCLRDGDAVVVQVVDGGPGLPPEEAAYVFERFWRADKARTRARGGSGLGLSIVASIAAAHGGTVRFDSSVERGSTVTMRLPAVAY